MKSPVRPNSRTGQKIKTLEEYRRMKQHITYEEDDEFLKHKYKEFETQVLLEKLDQKKKEKWMKKFQEKLKDEKFKPEESSETSSNRSYTQSSSDDILEEETKAQHQQAFKSKQGMNLNSEVAAKSLA